MKHMSLIRERSLTSRRFCLPVHSKRQRGATLIIAAVILLFASMAVLSAARSTIVMEKVSSNQMMKSEADNQSESAVAIVMSDETVITPLINQVLTGSPEATATVPVTLPTSKSGTGSVDVRVTSRPLEWWSLDKLSAIVIEVESNATVEGTQTTVEPVYQRVVPAI